MFKILCASENILSAKLRPNPFPLADETTDFDLNPLFFNFGISMASILAQLFIIITDVCV